MNTNDLAPWFHDLVSLNDAARIMLVDPSTIRHAIARGSFGLTEGQHYMKFGKQWVLHKSAIEAMTGSNEAWIAERGYDESPATETQDADDLGEDIEHQLEQDLLELQSGISPDNVTFWEM